MDATRSLAATLPDAAKDIRLNLIGVLADGSLTQAQRFGVALACGYASRNESLVTALFSDALPHIGEGGVDDAKAAAALMSMNNVYYRFRHMIGKPSYTSTPARLRMSRIANPTTTKLDFELMCLAISAIHGCEMCVRSHEQSLLEMGATEVQVHDAVRIAASVFATAVALELEPIAG